MRRFLDRDEAVRLGRDMDIAYVRGMPAAHKMVLRGLYGRPLMETTMSRFVVISCSATREKVLSTIYLLVWTLAGVPFYMCKRLLMPSAA